jgi:glycerophosphoryl diester phosphodiesterase
VSRAITGAAALVAALLAGPAGAAQPPAFDAQGHRGARGLAPENTLAGFARALEEGVTTLELDTVVTRDRVVVVSHEPRLLPDLTRGPEGGWLLEPGPLVFDLALAELESYDVGRARPGGAVAASFPGQAAADGERVPSLASVLAFAAGRRPDLRFNVETKLSPSEPEQTPEPAAFASAVVEVLREAGVIERSALQSFDWRTLQHARRLAPELERVCLTTREPSGGNLQLGRDGASPWLAGLDADAFEGSVPRLVEAAACQVWSPAHGDLEAAALAEAHALGLRVVVWTVNRPERMEELIRLGVDGIITDYPDRLREVMGRLGLPLPPRASR